MNGRKENKGITLVALVITMVILIIIAGISITGTIKGDKEAKESIQISELEIVQHAILERYTKSQLTKQSLPGEIVNIATVQQTIQEINTITGGNIRLKGTEYRILNESNLRELGIENEKDTFIVNYKTGEVINSTLKVTPSKQALYIFAKNSEEE